LLSRYHTSYVIYYIVIDNIMSDNIQFGLAIPQGWRRGDLPLEEENNPISQYQFSKSIAITADNLNLVTKLDSVAKTWTITGQVENRVSKIQRNVQVVAYFYDSKGNSVGGPYKGIVNPTVLKKPIIRCI
jgi:hypothetical protein